MAEYGKVGHKCGKEGEKVVWRDSMMAGCQEHIISVLGPHSRPKCPS